MILIQQNKVTVAMADTGRPAAVVRTEDTVATVMWCDPTDPIFWEAMPRLIPRAYLHATGEQSIDILLALQTEHIAATFLSLFGIQCKITIDQGDKTTTVRMTDLPGILHALLFNNKGMTNVDLKILRKV